MNPRETEVIAELMLQSGVQFGTSGARGLVGAMTDRVCYAYTRAFLQYLEASGQIGVRRQVAVAGDLRSSTPRILAAVGAALEDAGYETVNCGFIPSPAVALYGIRQGIPAIMVTGSHIPDDRNGIKFNTPRGEITKQDEAGLRAQEVAVPAARFDHTGRLREAYSLPPESTAAYHAYIHRYLDLFPADCLKGCRIGLYEHSSVARQALGAVLEGLGAEVLRRGRSETFVPVDTEAIRPEDIALAREWAAAEQLDSIVSTDGDGDRPLISDEHGVWLRGDVAGIYCARYLGARHVVTPVSCNSAVELSAWFESVARTRIGSPYVIAGMEEVIREGGEGVIGYEANGGFLTADRLELEGGSLEPLPTRDAVIVILGVLLLAGRWGLSVSGLASRLPARYTHSDRLQAFPLELSRSLLETLAPSGQGAKYASIERFFEGIFGPVTAVDRTDGVRVVFSSGEIAHLRPSGNAPELRCYNEADSRERVVEMNRICMGLLEKWRGQ